MKWLIQPTKVEAQKMHELMKMLSMADIAYDIVFPMGNKIETANGKSYVFKDEKYFVCGSYSLARLVAKVRPEAVFSLEDLGFDQLMDIFGKDNFVNHDARVMHSSELAWSQESLFIRPLHDDKSFNGGLYSKESFHYEGDIVVAQPKQISQEHRFFVMDSNVVTGSMYKLDGKLHSSAVVDPAALEFAQEMAQKLKRPGFVIDIGTIGNRYKIMELNCINAAGFYESNLYKFIMAVLDHYCPPHQAMKIAF